MCTSRVLSDAAKAHVLQVAWSQKRDALALETSGPVGQRNSDVMGSWHRLTLVDHKTSTRRGQPSGVSSGLRVPSMIYGREARPYEPPGSSARRTTSRLGTSVHFRVTVFSLILTRVELRWNCEWLCRISSLNQVSIL